MDETVVEIYIGAINRRRDDPRYDRLIGVIGNIQNELGVQIRADAGYFLANSVLDLVIAPVSQARELGIEAAEFSPDEALFERAEMDLRTVVKEAAEISARNGSDSISATSAIEALGQRVRELSLDDLQIWG